jgi:hypothetical protein
VPFALGIEVPALLLELDDLGRDILPGDRLEVLREMRIAYCHHIRHEWIEKPSLLLVPPGLCVIVSEFAELLACLDAELDAAVP